MIYERRAVGVERRKIVFPLLVFEVDSAFRSENHTIPAVSGGHHAVKHIYAPRHTFYNIGGSADAHQVTRLVFGQDVVDYLYHFVHHLHGFANGKPADGVAVHTLRRDKLRRLFPQILIDTALYDWEIRLRMSVQWVGFLKMLYAPCEPLVRDVERLGGVFVGARVGGALVESHHNVAADGALDVNYVFRREEVLAAVDVGAESNALVGDFPIFGKRKHLESAAVGKYRPVPADEFVETASLTDDVHAGAEIQVIGVAEDDSGIDVVAKFALVYAFYRPHSAYGHKNWGRNLAMSRGNQASTSVGAWVCMCYLEFHGRKVTPKFSFN